MANDNKKQVLPTEDQDIEWGENKQERLTDKAPRHKSDKHDCKGPACEHAFEKI